MLNKVYCIFPIEKHQVVTAGIYMDNNLNTVPLDVIDHIQQYFADHVKTICLDGTVAYIITTSLDVITMECKILGYEFSS